MKRRSRFTDDKGNYFPRGEALFVEPAPAPPPPRKTTNAPSLRVAGPAVPPRTMRATITPRPIPPRPAPRAVRPSPIVVAGPLDGSLDGIPRPVVVGLGIGAAVLLVLSLAAGR